MEQINATNECGTDIHSTMRKDQSTISQDNVEQKSKGKMPVSRGNHPRYRYKGDEVKTTDQTDNDPDHDLSLAKQLSMSSPTFATSSTPPHAGLYTLLATFTEHTRVLRGFASQGRTVLASQVLSHVQKWAGDLFVIVHAIEAAETQRVFDINADIGRQAAIQTQHENEVEGLLQNMTDELMAQEQAHEQNVRKQEKRHREELEKQREAYEKKLKQLQNARQEQLHETNTATTKTADARDTSYINETKETAHQRELVSLNEEWEERMWEHQDQFNQLLKEQKNKYQDMLSKQRAAFEEKLKQQPPVSLNAKLQDRYLPLPS